MIRAMCLILTIALVSSPLAAATLSACGCGTPPAADSVSSETLDRTMTAGCCGESGPERTPAEDNGDGPCDGGCDCPSACCSIAKPLVAPFRGVVTLSVETLSGRTLSEPQTMRGSPHVLGLKRPPRSVTTL